MNTLFNTLQQRGDLQAWFHSAEVAIVCLFLVGVWFLRPKTPDTGFQVREADLRKRKAPKQLGKDPLAEARIKRAERVEVKMLGGIRIDGQAHEILGVPSNALAPQIQKAYRELMKIYHPDRVGRPGSREWGDAQKIAEAINRAKEEMLKKVMRGTGS